MDVSFFGEMAWKSALIAGAALALAYVLRSRAASDRALVLRLGVAMLLLLPFIALALPALPIEAWAAPEPIAALPADFAYIPGPELPLTTLSEAGAQPAAPTIWDDPTPLVLLAYLGGLAMVGARLLAGLFMLGRWTRSAGAVDCPEWQAAFERARWASPDAERVRLLVSESVPSPLSWGWRNPVILIDPDTLAEPDEADAILAHEVAHIARRDWPVLMSTRIAAALFWFNPLVWLLEREVVQQAEEAADAEAARAVEPVHYAKTLLSLAQVNGRLIPANSIAPSGSALARRVKAILDRRLRERPSGSAWTKAAAILCIAIAAPVAAMQLVEAARAQETSAAPPAPPSAPGAPRPALPPRPPAPPHPSQAMMPPMPPIPDIPDVSPIVHRALAEVLPQLPTIMSGAIAAVDPEEIDAEISEALDEAFEEGRPEFRRMSRQDRERINRQVRRAVEQARQARNHVHRVEVRQVDRVRIAEAMARARDAERLARVSMAHGADGMVQGAAGMERGAQRMETEAGRLERDAAHRERIIARERARGHSVSHEELLEAARGMREGAEGMRDGAREMREAAERMRDGRE
ncbi:MAG TPA: M56 family metallopeptidase [Allosphingosinicella sp.]|nr:M56 family metallopeptidase [Allosphingosinicella sp.]